MIFASVGSMMPFDRLTEAVDQWASRNSETDIFLQIGRGKYEPTHCEWSRLLTHPVYMQKLQECTLFVAHVGMGSILQALQLGKPMLLMPRRADLQEHTTDHQLDTASKFNNIPGLVIVPDVKTLHVEMDRLSREQVSGPEGISQFAPASTLDTIRQTLGELA